MSKPTMQDIADKLNVSRNTVSRALRGKNGVSKATKKEILSVAEKIGYEYNENISHIEDTIKSRYILFCSSFALSQTSFFGIIIDELKDLVLEEGNILEIAEIPVDNIAIQNKWLEELKENNNQIDGVFILSHITDEFIKKVIQLQHPTVLIDHHSPEFRVDSILTQNEYGAYLLVEYLIKNNIREIGFIGNTEISPSYKERLNGYIHALSDNGIEYNESYVISDIQEEQKALFDRISKLDKLPESWFCVNSGLAFILNTYLHSIGYSIPEEISIVCFDNTEFSRQATPPITCVGTNLEAFAKLSYEAMKKRKLNDSIPITETRIVPDFFERESVKRQLP